MKKYTSKEIKEFIAKPLFDENIILKKDSNYPKVSIITPSYNQGNFIEETILSTKNQDYPNIEHIIIDGGSTDKTLDIIKKYEGTYNIRWISEKDEGQADAVNKGFNIARGEIIGWLNSDDIYVYKDVIKNVVNAFQLHPEADLIYGDVIIINKENIIRRVYPIFDFNYKKLLRYDFIAQPSLFFRREVIKKNKLRKELNYAMDYEFWLRLAKKYKFLYINKIIAADRNHAQRKNLPSHSGVFEEKRSILKNYRFQRESKLASFINWTRDRITVRWGRIRGIKPMLNLYNKESKENFTIKLKLRSKLQTLCSQLFKKHSEQL